MDNFKKMNIIRKYWAHKRIRKFLTIMTRTLAYDYGTSSEYTEGQVMTALKKLGYDGELSDIAVTIFCDEETSKKLGLDAALIKRYRGYSGEHDTGYGHVGSGSGHSSSFGDGGGSD